MNKNPIIIMVAATFIIGCARLGQTYSSVARSDTKETLVAKFGEPWRVEDIGITNKQLLAQYRDYGIEPPDTPQMGDTLHKMQWESISWHNWRLCVMFSNTNIHPATILRSHE
jgi:hypothetical protein